MERYDGNGRYHNAIIYNGLLFLSGQTATEAGDDIALQSAQTLEKVSKALNQYGSDKDHILHADVYVRDQDYVGAFNAAWDAWVNPETAPTRACMVTGLGRPAILVEVTVIAAVK